MKLLITTQAVDLDDPILGFFHRWLEEFAKYFEEIHVICLKKGRYDLPQNVHIYSLGKEEKISRYMYVAKFYKYVFELRGECDVVFSHMNPHYIVLAGLYWRFKKKRILFWRNHARMNLMTYIAAWHARNVFYTSQYACTTRFKHSVQMPVGIDTTHFKPDSVTEPQEKTILFLGRLSKVKRPELFLEAVKGLEEFSVSVYGDEPGETEEYTRILKEKAGKNTQFYGSVPNADTPKIYSAHEIYVNLTPKGSMDKTILEAASCGTLVLVSNEMFKGLLDSSMNLEQDDCQSIQRHLRTLNGFSTEKKKQLRTGLRKMVEDNHSLQKLAEFLYTYAVS